jgi:hypothetical protein
MVDKDFISSEERLSGLIPCIWSSLLDTTLIVIASVSIFSYLLFEIIK